MKLQQKHLKIVLGLLALAIVYNLWAFFGRRPATATGPGQPLLSGATASMMLIAATSRA